MSLDVKKVTEPDHDRAAVTHKAPISYGNFDSSAILVPKPSRFDPTQTFITREMVELKIKAESEEAKAEKLGKAILAKE